MATAKQIKANKDRKAKIAEKKAADIVKFKAKQAKEKAAEKAKAAKVKEAEKVKKAAEKEKAKKAKDEAKAKKIADKAAAKAAALLPVELTGQQMDLASIVNANQEIIINSGNSVITTILESGKHLMKLKEAVKAKDGKWEVWMKKNLILSDRQCQKYMKMAGDPKEVMKLLESMGEGASINAICNKLGQLKLTNDQLKARETKKAATKAAAEKTKAVLDGYDAVIVEVDTWDIPDMQELKQYLTDRINQKLEEAPPAPAEDAGDDTDADSTDAEDRADVEDHVVPHVNPIS